MPGNETPFDESTRRWLEDLTDGDQAVVIVRDAERRTVWLSENAPDVLDLHDVDIGVQLYSLVPPSDQRILLELSRALRDGEAKVGAATIHLAHPDGSVQAFACHLHDRLDDPAVRGVVSVVRPSGPPIRGGLLLGLHTVSTDLLIIQNDEPRTTYVSPNVERLLGIGPDRLRTVEDLVHADDVESYVTARQEVLEGTSERRLRIRLRHADGTYRTFDSVLANHFDDDRIGGLLIAARDVSDLARTEHELTETRAVFDAVLANSPDVPIAIDVGGVIGFCGPNITELLGYEPSELIGQNAFDYVHEDDREIALWTFGRFLEGQSESDPLLRIRGADGQYLLVEVVASDSTDVPGLGGYVLSLRDVSDRVRQQRRYDLALRHASGAALILDVEGRMIWSSHGTESFAGDVESIGESLDLDMFESDPPIDEMAFFASVVDGGPGTTKRVLGRLGPPGQPKRWVEVVFTNLLDDPAVEGIVCNIQDVDTAIRANEAGNRLVKVLESTTDMALIFDAHFSAIWGNAAARAVFGILPAADDAMREIMTPRTWTTVRREIIPTLRADNTWRGELTIRTPDGTDTPLDTIALAHRDAAGDIEYFSVIARDISERKALEDRLHAKARHDSLTGLPNRVLLTEQLEHALDRRAPLAIVFLDLDQFKEVNDTRGHDVGDQLLVAAADRLRNAARHQDVVARFGGDEFVVLLRDVTSLDVAVERAEQILATLRGPVRLDELEVYLTASVGVTVMGDATDVADLIAQADTAMYAAKEGGRDQVAPFVEDMRIRSAHRLDTAQQLRRALGRDELEVWFQPIVDTVLGLPIGLEALVRWSHPTRGIVTPEHFIRVAEETGLIVPLGLEVLHRTCQTVGQLEDEASRLTVAVNISARQLVDPELPERLAAELGANDLAPSRLCLEITESAVMHDLDASARALGALRQLGVCIAVDDFGTGYSSLAYLKRFPVDILKIDREFVSGLDLASDWDRSLAGGIVSLGHSLGLSVVAEGVETTEQAEILERLGCDALQGYLFSEAVPADELLTLLKRIGRRLDAPVTER